MSQKKTLFLASCLCLLMFNCLTGKTASAAGLVMTAAPTSASIASGSSRNITYSVKNDAGSVVQGARVHISIVSGTGSLSSPSCNTSIDGYCSISYTAPSTGGTTAKIEAEASDTGVSSNKVTTTITVNACPVGADVDFAQSSYLVGETIKLEGDYPTAAFNLCLYNPSNTLAAHQSVPAMSPKITISATATAGTWTGVLQLGTSCPSNLSSAGGCRESLTVTGSASTSSGWQCTSDHAVNEGTSTMTACSEVCAGGTCTGTTCPTGGSNFCSTAKAACMCSSSGGGSSSGGSGSTSGGSGSGKEDSGPTTAANPLPSNSRCDTNAWLYCNPLAGTIETLMEAGTKSAQALLGLIGTIALLFLIIAGISYMTAAGDEEKIKNAKRIITGTIIGLGIALVSFSLLQAILDILDNK